MRRSVLRPHETLAQIAADEAAGNLAVGALAGDELVAVGMITPGRGSEGWRVRGMATAPEFRGRGAGGAVLRALVEAAIAGGAERVWCNARTPARTLYERAGFTVVSDEFELPEIGPHYVMERRLG